MGHSSVQIFTKFDDGLKERNIKGLKKTYLGVLLSIELNSKTSKIAKGIKEQIKDLIQDVPLFQNLWRTLLSTNIKGQIVVDGEQVPVTLTKQSEDTYNVKFDKNTSKVDVKNVTDYSTKDLLTLCGQHELTVGKDKKDDYVFGVTIKGDTVSPVNKKITKIESKLPKLYCEIKKYCQFPSCVAVYRL